MYKVLLKTKRFKVAGEYTAANAPHTLLLKMRLRILGLLLGLLSFVSAFSATGNSLLVILEEESEKNKHSQLWADLERKTFTMSNTLHNLHSNTSNTSS